ncbi:MAG: hypothetical protein AAGE85_16755 [Pseudomonadota bacterium]
MPAKPIPPAVLEAARHATAVEPELLNSERIEARFGSYGIDLIEDREGLRLASLYSSNNGNKVCRTFAAVCVNGEHRELLPELEAIGGGRSIGATFRRNGWAVAKRTLYTGTATLAALREEVAAAMRLAPPESLALHVYQLVLDKNGRRIDYATILELHHPQYIDAAELAALFPEGAADSTINRDAVRELLTLFELNP